MYCDSQLDKIISTIKTVDGNHAICRRCGNHENSENVIRVYRKGEPPYSIHLCDWCYSDLIDWIGEIE